LGPSLLGWQNSGMGSHAAFLTLNTSEFHSAAAAVLFERESLYRHTAPRRAARQGKARQGVAGTLGARASGGGGFSTDFESDGGLVAPAVASTVTANGDAHSGFREDAGLVAGTLQAQGSFKGQDAFAGLLVPSGFDNKPLNETAACVSSKWSKHSGESAGDECQNLVAHALAAQGCDASEDGTGRGSPLVAIGFDSTASSGANVSRDAFKLAQRGVVSPTMRSASGHATGSGHLAIAFAESRSAAARYTDGDGGVMSTLNRGGHCLDRRECF